MKTLRISLVGWLLLLAVAVSAVAQQQSSSQRNAFREKYKYTFQLMQMVRHIGEIDKDKKYTLTPDQAKKVLGVLKPLRSKPKLTQDQAKETLKNLKKIFTATQLNAMARIKPKFRPQQGNRSEGNRPQGNRPPQEQRRFDPNAMKDFNPFYSKVDKKDPRSAERAKVWDQFFSGLEKKANSKKK